MKIRRKECDVQTSLRKLIVNFVMAKDPSIPRRNKVNWHYARDDPMFHRQSMSSQKPSHITPKKRKQEDWKRKAEGLKRVPDSPDYDSNVISPGSQVEVQKPQEIKDTHVTLTLVNPDGQQQSSSVSSGFIIPVTANLRSQPSYAPTNHPLTPTPLFAQLQQPPILTPATTPSSLLKNLPNFGSLFGFDNKLKALEDNFSEFKQTNQYAEALSSILGIIDQYLANKMKEAVDVAVQLKSDRIREEAQAENQQFLDSIDEGN
ncbi:hypothetical protein Tco_1164817 [Tanacetum coccineum]